MTYDSKYFSARLVNGVYGDPAVYITFKNSGTAALFDAGSLEVLSAAELLRVRHVFISHTHIDHFIGLDRLIRVHIPHGHRVSIVGPPGIAVQVAAKFQAYSWNLLEPGQICWSVYEFAPDGSAFKTYCLSNDRGFQPQPQSDQSSVLEFAGVGRVSGVLLDHGIPSAAYEVCAYPIIKVNRGALGKLRPGPWISRLQQQVLDGSLEGCIRLDGDMFDCRDLAQRIFSRQCPYKIAYVTDLGFTTQNQRKLQALTRGCDLLICESNFLKKDRRRATERKHLTTDQTLKIRDQLAAKNLLSFHYSTRYARDLGMHQSELGSPS